MSIATCEGVTGTVRDVMKRIVPDSTKLYTGMEQGSGNTAVTRCNWLGRAKCARLKSGLTKNMQSP